MKSGTDGGAERRAHARFPIRLPVRVTLFTSPLVERDVRRARAPTTPPPIVFQATAADVSERGLRLDVGGDSLKAVLDSSDPLVGLEVSFMHGKLRSMGPRAGHVQWRRAGSEKNTWVLGARLDLPFAAEELSRILRCSESAPKTRPPVVAVVLTTAALLAAFALYRAYVTQAAEKGRVHDVGGD